MAASIINRLSLAVQNVEKAFIYTIFGRHFPPPEAIYISTTQSEIDHSEQKPFSLEDIIGDGFLFAVPKARRTVEKRWQRKFGWPEYVWKPLKPKNRLRICNTCGHHHEPGILCVNCYQRIKAETKEMQDAITDVLQLNPVEEEVVVLYEGEKLDQPEEFWKGKRVVEMPKPRPPWFSKNLLQRTTQQPATTTDVKPTELA